jgi:dolichol-phosphate mannosyltransferase
MKSLVIIPTFNEIENIQRMLDTVMKLEAEFNVLIVDDGSPDGTAKVVKENQKKHDRIHLLERSGKLGLGTAYIAGFHWALERVYDLIN